MCNFCGLDLVVNPFFNPQNVRLGPILKKIEPKNDVYE
jgi:hypothetical protein